MTSDTSHETAQLLGALARQLASNRGVEATLDAVVNSAASTLSDLAAVGVSYLDGGRTITARAESDKLVTAVDELQSELQQGPCFHVLTNPVDMVRVDDLRVDERWPRFAQGAVDRGVLSVLSFRLYVEDETLGNLSFFANQANAFDETTEVVGELYATHAAVALSGIRLEHQFNQAVRSRDVIGQAKGVLMAQHNLDEDTAFATLVRYSQQHHIKLYDVAHQLVQSLQSNRKAGRDVGDGTTER
jgi:transcriptional regulator with GAF, ATPase, and Fis domain